VEEETTPELEKAEVALNFFAGIFIIFRDIKEISLL
jgi:hypothetical protein